MSFNRRSCKFVPESGSRTARVDYSSYKEDTDKTRLIIYTTTDAEGTVLANGYFNQLADEIDIGTTIFVVLVDMMEPNLRSDGIVIPVMVIDK